MVVISGLLKRLARLCRRRSLLRVISYLVCAVTVAVLVLYFLLAYHLADDPRLVPGVLRQARNIVLVTAHPDDETLFFSPSILYHRHEPHVTRSLLVISSGNYNGIGDQRLVEVHNSCAALGISQDRCVVGNHPDLQDNPTKWWDEDVIASIVGPHVEKWHADVIMTFDHGGISGHINHRAVSAGVKKYVSTTQNAPPAFALQSTALLRKYSSLIDLLPTALPFSWRIAQALLASPLNPDEAQSATAPRGHTETALLVSSWQTYLESRAAFSQHQSQYSWDRVLYLVISRYMWFNTLERLG
ncbi:hypothetical protein ARAM_001660 [Aspergillus rambellii]|uniref:N-acetylglucosaminylphosphatidylinositol deacetylase n=1 Tax=Aspergillus rambellii TaxID=308745 RepID=A0A0F8V9J7_9EURO|nr:hypothetical protein ARAM_001660 [Aspergillus rambellii]